MFDLLTPLTETWSEPLKMAFVTSMITLLILLRYVVFTTTAFGFSRLIARVMPWRRLQSVPFTAAQIKREIGYSVLSVLVFTAVVGVIVLMSRAGWTRIYSDADQYGTLWFWLQVPVALLIQDLYFYWMHRLVHRPRMYQRVHKAHHLSTNPSAFAAFAFHPLEAVLEIGIFAVIVVVIPMHAVPLLLVSLFSLTYNVYGHLGYEIMPRFIGKSRLGFVLNKSAYHNQHHRTFRYNFGLYTVIWDRLHGTLHPRAEQLYDAVTIRTAEADSIAVDHVKSH